MTRTPWASRLQDVEVTDGARITLRLLRVGAEGVEYGAAVELPDGECSTNVTVQLSDGACRLAEWQPAAPPEWASQLVCAVLRTEWRQRKDGAGPAWPRRLSRWRGSRD